MSKIRKRKLYYIIIILDIIIISLALCVNIKLPAYQYNIEKNSDYKILLKENNFYPINNPSNDVKAYPSKGIDDIIIDFKYILNGNKNTNLNYRYNVTANLVGTVNSSDELYKKVWNKEFILAENVDSYYTGTYGFSIEKKVNVNYEYFNELVNSYEKEYGISIDAILKVKLNIFYNIDLSRFKTENEKADDYIEVDIPINNTTTEIKEVNNESKEKIFYMERKQDKSYEILYLSGGAILIILTIILIVIDLKKNKKSQEEIYKSNIKHIFKYYKNLIVSIKNKPDIDDLKSMEIMNLNDLIDIAEQNQKNIIYYEIEKNKESKLYVIVDKYVYIYGITGTKLK